MAEAVADVCRQGAESRKQRKAAGGPNAIDGAAMLKKARRRERLSDSSQKEMTRVSEKDE